jgi:hypothetical protein
MAYFLGRDVKVAITTEDASNGIEINATTPDVAQPSTATSGDVIEVLGGTLFDAGSNYNPFTDVTSVDLTLGKVDEDIAYIGQRTALKAEIKNETTLVITKKKDGKFWDHVFMDARYGISGTALAEAVQPTTEFGYRLYVQLKSANEVISIPNCVLADKSTSLNADGVTEETLTFSSNVTPAIDTIAYQTPTTSDGSTAQDL